jgi:predicted outer membrane repeat protein
MFAALVFSAVRPGYAADAVVGDGTPGSCTEAAFDAALATAVVGGGTITFDCGPSEVTIPFTLAKIVLLGDVTIDGDDRVILNANNTDRLFFAGGGITFTLREITLRDGNSLVGGGAIETSGATVILDSVRLINNYSSISGGAIYCFDGDLTIRDSLLENNASATGGAIYNDGCEVTITNTTFRGNEALDVGGRGGAIANLQPGKLTIDDTVFETNEAPDGGGLFNDANSTATLGGVSFIDNKGGYGGGLENSGTITVTDSLFVGNEVTGSGGGLWNLGGTVMLERTTVRDNTAYEGGGVNSYGATLEMTDVNIIDNLASGSNGGGLYHGGGTAFIRNATISGNRATDPAANGGGIYQNSDDNLTLTNVTLTGNEAGALGGGFYHYARYAILTNVTIADNIAGAAGDAIYEDSPMTPAFPGVVQIANSVLFGSANNCDGGFFDSLGHNISRGTCAPLDEATDQDNYTGDLLVGPLAFNGGAFSMETFLPQAGSPLIDAADPALCPALDQRGVARVDACDIGAVEYEPPGPGVLYLPVAIR